MPTTGSPQELTRSTAEILEHLVHELSRCSHDLVEVQRATIGEKHQNWEDELVPRPLNANDDSVSVPGVLLPTQGNILETLRESFLSVFGVSSVLKDQKLPRFHLQRDLPDLGPEHTYWGPMPGNDFHIKPSIIYDRSAWSSLLQFAPSNETTRRTQPSVIPFAHLRQHPSILAGPTLTVDEAASKLRAAWPSTTINSPKRRLLGSRFTEPSSVEYAMFSWLASQDLNSEGVGLKLPLHPRGYFISSDEKFVRWH
ncbi:hypothetical protein SLS62_005833 [Diatrype stigma]|uniref:Uncharacterized protein n=1 Tax=Diatrype stigma TaxID=117547 RepID=A0AAN9YRV2_9PEZI